MKDYFIVGPCVQLHIRLSDMDMFIKKGKLSDISQFAKNWLL